MADILYSISGATLSVTILCYFALLWFRAPSTDICIITPMMIALSGAHMFIEPGLIALANSDLERWRDLVRFLWYVGFAFTDLIFVLSCIYICKVYNFPSTYTGRLILMVKMTLVFFNLIRYLDRVVIGTDVMAGLYRIAIPTGNILVACAMVYAVYRLTKYRLTNV